MKSLSSLLVATLLLPGCHKNIETKEAVRQGVLDYLAKRQDLMSMDVTISAVKFNGKQADALVYVTAKGGPTPGSGMQMRYLLDRQGEHWVVKPRANASPHAGAEGQPLEGSPHGATPAMPPGHPDVPQQTPRGPGK